MLDKDKIKYIALDLDGTLLNDDLEITEKTKEALKKVQDKGIELVIASGRPIEGIFRYAEELEIDKHHGLIIASNGSRLYDIKEKKDIFEDKLSAEDARRVLREIEKFDIHPFVAVDHDMYVQDYNAAVIDTKSHLGVTNVFAWEVELGNFTLHEVDRLSEFIDFPIYKINSAADPEYIDENFEEFDKNIKDIAYCARTLSFALEFIKAGISKGHALEKINAKPEEIIAFGDSMNDLQMVEYAKFGVAMENAMPIVKDAAFEITKSNNDDGIYHFLEKYGFLD